MRKVLTPTIIVLSLLVLPPTDAQESDQPQKYLPGAAADETSTVGDPTSVPTNRSTAPSGTLPNRTMASGDTLNVDVSQAFVDADDDRLTYTVSSSTPRVARASLSGAFAMLVAGSEGAATIRVTANDPGGLSAVQSFTVTVARSPPTPFTDHPIQPGLTPIKAVHFTELRARIDALRRVGGLQAFPWTDMALRTGLTPVRLAHLLELREALADAHEATGRAAPSWTDVSPAPRSTPIRAAHVMELRAAVIEPIEITITAAIPYPTDTVSFDVDRGLPGVTVTCLDGCEGAQTDVTDGQGAVTLTANVQPLIRADKQGYIATEQRVSHGSEVAMGNEWPPESELAIRQLGLANAIASGKILLIWADKRYLPARARNQGSPGLGGEFHCPVVIVRDWQDRRKMLSTLVHELIHDWMRSQVTGISLCNPDDAFWFGTEEGKAWFDAAWVSSEEGDAWIVALERDLRQHGPIPGFDDQIYGGSGKLLSELPRHSLAQYYAAWYVGRVGEELIRFRQLAPNRWRYLEDLFGPPPPRQ